MSAALTIVALAAASVLVAGVDSASASVTKSINGTVNAASPSYVHPVAPCGGGSVTSHYQVVAAKLVGSAASTLTVTVTASSGFNPNLAVYQGVFLPDNPIVNCFGDVEGTGVGDTLTYSTPTPDLGPFSQTDETFYLVVSGQTSRSVGTFTMSVTSSTSSAVILSSSTVPLPPDTTKPVLTVPSTITQEATSGSGAAVTYRATATDDTDGTLAPSCSPSSGSTFAIGSTTVNCTVKDAANNSASGSFAVTVQDTTGPEMSVDSGVSVAATSASGAAVSWHASATDAVSGSEVVTCTPANGSTFPVGASSSSCSAKDALGNASTSTVAITVTDDAPVITVPSDITVEATGTDGASVGFPTSALDVVDGSRPVTCVPASGSEFPVGSTTVTCSSSDTTAHSSSKIFAVHVVDTTGPVITAPIDLTEEATGPDGATATFSATATDLVDGTRPVTCVPASGSVFPLGTTTVNCSSSDVSSNVADTSFSVNVGDTTGPTLQVPTTITREATSASGTAVDFGTSASDLVDGTLPVTCDAASSSTFPVGSSTVHCSATDADSNVTRSTFAVVVDDTTAPTLTLPAAITVKANGLSGAKVPYSASAADIVDGAVVPTCSTVSDALFPATTTTVSCTATDKHGNVSRGSFTVTVQVRTPIDVTTPTDTPRVPGTPITITAGGLAPNEPYVITIDGKKVRSGHADSAGRVSVSIALPKSLKPGKHTISVVGSDGVHHGGITVRTLKRVKKFTITAKPSPVVQANRMLTLTVHGLAAGEPVKVVYNGHRVSPRKAKGSKSGLYRITISAGYNWGRRTATATGLISTRHGSARVAVGPRLAATAR